MQLFHVKWKIVSIRVANHGTVCWIFWHWTSHQSVIIIYSNVKIVSTIHPVVLCQVSLEVDNIWNGCCSYSVKWHHWSCIIRKSLVAIASTIKPRGNKVSCFIIGDRKQYCSLTKECPWAEHLTSLLKRGMGTLSSVSVSNHKKRYHIWGFLQSSAPPHESATKPWQRATGHMKGTHTPCWFRLPPWESVNKSMNFNHAILVTWPHELFMSRIGSIRNSRVVLPQLTFNVVLYFELFGIELRIKESLPFTQMFK